jgi:hypothetical protein
MDEARRVAAHIAKLTGLLKRYLMRAAFCDEAAQGRWPYWRALELAQNPNENSHSNFSGPPPGPRAIIDETRKKFLRFFRALLFVAATLPRSRAF